MSRALFAHTVVQSIHSALAYALGILAGLALPACMPEPDVAGSFADDARAGASASESARADPREGLSDLGSSALQLSALTWNLEWLGDPREGPTDDARQLAIARETLLAQAPTLAGLQEIAAPGQLQALVEAWPNHAVVLSSYAQRQQVALVYDREIFDLEAVQAVLGPLENTGRPPLEVALRSASGELLYTIVLHAKAGSDQPSWELRARLATALHDYLAHERREDRVLLLGDFNDLFELSTVSGQPSPYAALFRDGLCISAKSSAPNQTEFSTIWGVTVDHVVVCGALVAARLQNANVLRDELLAHPDFFDAVSDHAPVRVELAY